MYGIRLSRIFEIPSISNKKPSVSIEIPSISKNTEILGFSQLKLEILRAKHLVFQNRCEIPGFKWIFCISSSIDIRSSLRIRRLLCKYYTPVQLYQQQKHSTQFADSSSDPLGESGEPSRTSTMKLF